MRLRSERCYRGRGACSCARRLAARTRAGAKAARRPSSRNGSASSRTARVRDRPTSTHCVKRSCRRSRCRRRSRRPGCLQLQRRSRHSTGAGSNTLEAEGRWVRRRVLAAVAASTAVIVGALVLAGEVRNPFLRVPNVVSLREGVARAQIRAIAAGGHGDRAAHLQHPCRRRPRDSPATPAASAARIRHGGAARRQQRHAVRVGSRGRGQTGSNARASLARRGFASRYTYAPSWTVRKGSVVGLQPARALACDARRG